MDESMEGFVGTPDEKATSDRGAPDTATPNTATWRVEKFSLTGVVVVLSVLETDELFSIEPTVDGADDVETDSG
jgi:hypothetical protein